MYNHNKLKKEISKYIKNRETILFGKLGETVSNEKNPTGGLQGGCSPLRFPRWFLEIVGLLRVMSGAL